MRLQLGGNMVLGAGADCSMEPSSGKWQQCEAWLGSVGGASGEGYGDPPPQSLHGVQLWQAVGEGGRAHALLGAGAWLLDLTSAARSSAPTELFVSPMLPALMGHR